MALDPATTSALIKGGSAVLGGVLGGLGGNEEHYGPGDLYPDWMKQIRRDLGAGIGQLQTQQFYPGELTAGQHPWTLESNQAAYDWGGPGGRGTNLADASGFAGLAGLQSMGAGLDYMSELRSGGPNAFNYDQGTFDQIMGNLTPGLEGAHAALMRDPIRQFQEQTIPGINAGAAGAGQSFGTRPFNTGAIAARGLADRSADVGSQLWMNAANQANQGGYGAGVQNLASANRMQGDLLSNYGKYGELGATLLGQGYDMGVGNVGMQLDAAGRQQGWDQQWINDAKQRWDFEQQAPWSALNDKLAMMKQFEMGGMPTTQGLSTLEGINQGIQTGGMVGGLANDAWGWWQNRGGGGGGGAPSGSLYSGNPMDIFG